MSLTLNYMLWSDLMGQLHPRLALTILQFTFDPKTIVHII